MQSEHDIRQAAFLDNEKDNEYDVIIVGAGLSGAVFADRFAREQGKRVLVVDKRDHIAGNCYYYANQDGLLISKYGLHLFHCNSDRVYNYIRRFGDWVRYDHTVVARVGRKLVPVPVNIETVNMLCDANIQNTREMDEWLAANQVKYEQISNGEEAAKARVGTKLYEALFKDYTMKQWNKSPAELDRSVLERIPVRNDHDPRYFTDRYQVLPIHGYTAFVEAMLQHPLITVKLNTHFNVGEYRHKDWLIYTGPIDRYFANAGLPALEYRSIRFEEERVESRGYYQERLVINYPSPNVKFTRCVEYKHLPHNNFPSTHTTIVREYTTDEGEPYYPVPNPRNQALYEEYKVLAEKEETNGVLFIGRLASYKYKDMHVAIEDALNLFDQRCV